MCVNGPSVYGGDYDDAAIDAIIALGAECVRVNVRQDVWSSIDDPTPHGWRGLSLLESYDAIVDRFEAAGISVYILVNHEAAGIAPDAARWTGGLDVYASAFVSIADHFKDRVTYYEAFNEPNNWIAPNYPALDARSFARLLGRVWSDVRMAHPDWDVRIVAGAPFAFHQIGGSSTNAADYLDETFKQGLAHEGWGTLRADSGSYPADGFGYHFYFDNESSAATAARVNSFVGAYGSIIDKYEGVGTSKRIFVSELGWQTDDTASGDADQARELDAAFGALLGNPRIAMGMWFNLQDFNEGENPVRWGLYRQGGLDDSYARPARDHFRALCTGLAGGGGGSGSGGGGGGGGGGTVGGGGGGGIVSSTEALDVRFPVGAGGWVTQCTSDAELVFQTGGDGRDEYSAWAPFKYPQMKTAACGAPSGGRYPIVFRSEPGGTLGATWVAQCNGSGQTRGVYRIDSEVDGHPAAAYLYDEATPDCP